MFDEEKVFTHPSYGQLEVTRCSSGSPQTLYGSSIQHQQTIRLRLYESNMSRSLSNDWHMTGRTFFEVEMSQSQWAEVVSSVGIGGGVPCTIRSINGQQIDNPPCISKRSEFDQEFNETVQSSLNKMDEALRKIESLLSKPSVTKTDRSEILSLIQSAKQDICSNLPFIKRQFTEQMDKTVKEARGEVEAYQLAQLTELSMRIISLKNDTNQEATLPKSGKNKVQAKKPNQS